MRTYIRIETTYTHAFIYVTLYMLYVLFFLNSFIITYQEKKNMHNAAKLALMTLNVIAIEF